MPRVAPERFCAVIPAKGTSIRLANKNLLPVAGVPLVTRKIRQLKTSMQFENIYVATDSEEIAGEARGEDCLVMWREPEWADDSSERSLSETIRHLATQVDEEHIYWAQCTSPFVGPTLITEAISRYKKARVSGHDSLISQQKISEFLWLDGVPTNYAPGAQHVRSQALPELMKMTFGILVASKENMVKWSYYHGPNPAVILLDKIASVDIDDEFDYEITTLLSEFHSEGESIDRHRDYP